MFLACKWLLCSCSFHVPFALPFHLPFSSLLPLSVSLSSHFTSLVLLTHYPSFSFSPSPHLPFSLSLSLSLSLGMNNTLCPIDMLVHHYLCTCSLGWRCDRFPGRPVGGDWTGRGHREEWWLSEGDQVLHLQTQVWWVCDGVFMDWGTKGANLNFDQWYINIWGQRSKGANCIISGNFRIRVVSLRFLVC